jgi:DNA replication protein DnaC
MKQGACKQLNLSHLEAALPQLLEGARREQWTYETFLERLLAAELEGREQKTIARRLKAARVRGYTGLLQTGSYHSGAGWHA